MNKWELIEDVEKIGIYNLNLFGNKVKSIPTKTAIKLINQLDEPEKPVVPQFVADWYEENKDYFEFNVWDWMAFRDEAEKLENREFNNWINDSRENPIQTLVNMHQFGYEVEEDKKFFVKIKCLSEEYKYLNYFKSCREWLFSEKEETKEYRTAHTRKELEEAGFSEVFNSPLFEVLEVE